MPKKDPAKARDDARVMALQEQIEASTQKAVWAFRFVWDQQTESEKLSGRDLGIRDHRGFQPHTTEQMNDLYEDLEDQGWKLTPAQCDRLRAVMPSYARQILRITGKIRDPYAKKEAS